MRNKLTSLIASAFVVIIAIFSIGQGTAFASERHDHPGTNRVRNESRTQTGDQQGNPTLNSDCTDTTTPPTTTPPTTTPPTTTPPTTTPPTTIPPTTTPPTTTPPTTTPPTTTPPTTTPPTTTPPTTTPPSRLPNTGFPTGKVLLIGGALVLFGTLLVCAGRRGQR